MTILKVIGWLLTALFSAAGLLIGSVMIFLNIVWWSSEGTDADGGAGSQWMRARYHDGPRYFEVTAKLEVERAPVEITRVMECEPYFFHRFGEGYFKKRWYMRNDAMTHRLPDGSGVIVLVPKLCDAFAHPQPAGAPQWRASPDFPDDYVPLIFWTADADNPEVLEGYHSFAALNRPDSRVRFKSISLRNDPTLKPSPSPNEFGVMSTARYVGNPEGHRPKRDLNYTGYYLISADEEDWRTVPELNAALSPSPDSRFLEPRLQAALHSGLKVRANHILYGVGGDLDSRVRQAPSGGEARSGVVVYDIFPVQRTNDALVAMTDVEGIILYYLDDPGRPSGGDSGILVGSTEIPWQLGSPLNLYYEASSGAIVEFWRSRLSFHQTGNRN
ncbi:hypothetical protein [Pelagibius sp.]|uniref:hypothetical protein n=1 Tax=Pelagibius sp. TaxID=1931238 RepID=UPI002627EE50|nr:hypothetical protein [Pelagibius sp.]